MINNSKYNDMIYMQRPISKKYIQMDIKDRAGQFAPFAVLTGHKESVEELNRVVDKKIELDEQSKEILNNKIKRVLENIDGVTQIKITYFIKDEKKDGGTYITIKDIIKKYDMYRKLLFLNSGLEISIDNILDLILC